VENSIAACSHWPLRKGVCISAGGCPRLLDPRGQVAPGFAVVRYSRRRVSSGSRRAARAEPQADADFGRTHRRAIMRASASAGGPLTGIGLLARRTSRAVERLVTLRVASSTRP
jgi:hypothetical protein